MSEILDMGNIVPTFEHIKGHHDKKIKYEELSLSAKLSVDANLLEVEFWASNANSTRKAIRLPVNTVQLHMNGVTVNSNYF
eukprot:9780415-Ditylum_brightwellii.AAC.1